MSTIQTNYGTNGQAITCSLATLATGSFQQSTAIDNSSNLFLDALVMVGVKTNAASTSATGYVNVYAYGTVNSGTNYTDNATGTNGSFTPTSPTNLRLIGTINAVANATTYYGGPWSVSQAFGGVLPQKWGIVVENETGAALDGTEGNHFKNYQGIQATAI